MEGSTVYTNVVYLNAYRYGQKYVTSHDNITNSNIVQCIMIHTISSTDMCQGPL